MPTVSVLICLLTAAMPCFGSTTLKLHVFTKEPAKLEEENHKLKVHVFTSPTKNDSISFSEEGGRRTAIQQNKSQELQHQKASFYIKTGVQHDEHRWTISGLNGSPNILSELIWDNLRVAKIDAGFNLSFHDDWIVNADLGYGRIYDGENQDSDYLGNNRTLEFSRSNNSADEGDLYDISLSIGKLWYSDVMSAKLIPKIGYSFRAQNLKMKDGYQTVSDYGFSVPLGSFSGLDASYDATWQGPWLGFDAIFSLNKKFSVNLGTEFHYTFYDAVATWNLRTDLAQPTSFTNKAEGVGMVIRLGTHYAMTKRINISLDIEKESWDADRNGETTTYLSNGSILTGQPFNDATRRSTLFNLGMTYQFD